MRCRRHAAVMASCVGMMTIMTPCARVVDAARTLRDAIPLVPVRAPLLTPLVAPWMLRSWQPVEFSIASDPDVATPEYVDESDDAASYVENDVHDVEEEKEEEDEDVVVADWHDVRVDPQSAAISFKRQGWTGFGVETAATFVVSPP